LLTDCWHLFYSLLLKNLFNEIKGIKGKILKNVVLWEAEIVTKNLPVKLTVKLFVVIKVRIAFSSLTLMSGILLEPLGADKKIKGI